MKSVIEWLDGDVIVFRISNTGEQISHKMQIFARLAELIAVNNGQIKVSKVGPAIPMPEHPYKRVILNLNEALELEGLHGVMVGFILCTDDPKVSKAATEKIRLEIVRVNNEGFNPVPGMDDSVTGLVQVYDKIDAQQMTALNKAMEKKIHLGN